MKTENKLGIWMDHSTAHLIEFVNGSSETKTITLKLTHDEKKESLKKSEHIMHNKENREQAAFYKELGSVIKNYSEVILSGPTDAKSELLNILTADHLFEKIKINLKQAERISDNQKHAFVKDYFSKRASL